MHLSACMRLNCQTSGLFFETSGLNGMKNVYRSKPCTSTTDGPRTTVARTREVLLYQYRVFQKSLCDGSGLFLGHSIRKFKISSGMYKKSCSFEE